MGSHFRKALRSDLEKHGARISVARTFSSILESDYNTLEEKGTANFDSQICPGNMVKLLYLYRLTE